MDESISAAEANREFSRLLRGVREGRRYVVTSHGKPVARIVPAVADDGSAGAQAILLARLSRQAAVRGARWTREELYEDDP